MEPFPNQEGSVSRLTTLTTVMHAGLPKTFSSSGYKSQKKNQTQREGGEKKRKKRKKRVAETLGGEREERKRTGRIEKRRGKHREQGGKDRKKKKKREEGRTRQQRKTERTVEKRKENRERENVRNRGGGEEVTQWEYRRLKRKGRLHEGTETEAQGETERRSKAHRQQGRSAPPPVSFFQNQVCSFLFFAKKLMHVCLENQKETADE